MTKAKQARRPVAPRAWDRLLWGVEFRSGGAVEVPMIIGNLWARDFGGEPYPGEPTRPLLFCTRAQARTWCAETLRKWRYNRHAEDSVMRWPALGRCAVG